MESVSDPTIDALRRIVYGMEFDLRSWSQLGEEGALFTHGLIERTDSSDATPDHRRTLKIARRALALVHGDVRLDPDVAMIAELVTGVRADDLLVDRTARDQLRRAIGEPGVVIASGSAGSGRRSLLVALAHERGERVLAIDGTQLSKDRELARRQLRAIARECVLFDAIPLLRHLDAVGGENDRLDLIEFELGDRILATSAGSVSRKWSKPVTLIELPTLSGADREVLWQRALPMAAPSDARTLASLYPLAPALIATVGASAIRIAGNARMEPHHIAAGLRTVLDNRLAGLASRVSVTQTWDDLVLPPEQASAVVEFLSRIRHRRQVYEDWGFARKVSKGLGVTAMFSGPPGTGKTMCAGLIARDLGTELYQVDLSKIVSKWIGETEKNLASVFDAAEAGHAVLLFDEADAVFGKRTEVRSSNDRHANQETNYLLQRLESFTGICILTTNHESAIDEAFRRRLSIHVRLPIPETEERRRLWAAMLPLSAPVDDIDFDRLAERYEMSGGYIRNAVLRAAFLAANEKCSITTGLLSRGAQLEYEAMGKL